MSIWSSDILYTEDKKSNKRQWQVYVRDVGDGTYGVKREFGMVDGIIQTSEKIVSKGKNIGKKNETSPMEQAIAEAKALYKKQTPDNKVLPMLASTWTKKSRTSEYVYVQPKLDGVRLLVGKQNGEIMVLTRTGKPVTGMTRIPDASHMREGEWLDGEAYSPYLTFEEISGKFRKNASCPELEFHIFDRFMINNTEEPFQSRVKDLSQWPCPVMTMLIHRDRIEEMHDNFVADGYEGIIIREPDSPYEIGYRSKNLLKFKKFDTDEFKIVDCVEGTARDTGTAIFVCVCDNGKTFNVRPKGPHAIRSSYWSNRKDYMGKLLTVQYQGTSVDTIPRFPVGITIRDYE